MEPINILVAFGVVLTFVVATRISNSAVKRYGKKNDINPYRLTYISKTISFGIGLLFAIAIVNVVGLEYSQISFFVSSVFAVIGVALFAQWSFLSNITASLIIFFGFPYRVGDRIKVVDKDDDISGVIHEITLFHVLIKNGSELITYPNTLILQKAVIKNPAPERWPNRIAAAGSEPAKTAGPGAETSDSTDTAAEKSPSSS